MKILLFGLALLTSISSFAATTVSMDVNFLFEGEEVKNVSVIKGKQIVEGVYCGNKVELDSTEFALDFREELTEGSGKLYDDQLFFCLRHNKLLE